MIFSCCSLNTTFRVGMLGPMRFLFGPGTVYHGIICQLHRGSKSPPLIRRRAHHEPVERRLDLDLARQARGRLGVEGEIEHVLFFRRALGQALEPRLVHIHVAGRAGARAAAFGDDPGDPVADRGLHHGRADLGLDPMGGAVVLDVRDLRHEDFCACGGGDSRLQYSASWAARHGGATWLRWCRKWAAVPRVYPTGEGRLPPKVPRCHRIMPTRRATTPRPSWSTARSRAASATRAPSATGRVRSPMVNCACAPGAWPPCSARSGSSRKAGSRCCCPTDRKSTRLNS